LTKSFFDILPLSLSLSLPDDRERFSQGTVHFSGSTGFGCAAEDRASTNVVNSSESTSCCKRRDARKQQCRHPPSACLLVLPAKSSRRLVMTGSIADRCPSHGVQEWPLMGYLIVFQAGDAAPYSRLFSHQQKTSPQLCRHAS
jgi:hypothetical protein